MDLSTEAPSTYVHLFHFQTGLNKITFISYYKIERKTLTHIMQSKAGQT